MMPIKKTLGELTELVDAKIKGNANTVITGVATLQSAKQGDITFLANPKYTKYLSETCASAVIITKDAVDRCVCDALIVADPHYAYSQIASQFVVRKERKPGVHKTAVVGKNCQIDSTAFVGANVVIGDNVSIGAHTTILPGCVVGDDVQIGEDCFLFANATIYDRSRLHHRVIIHSGAVIGSDGFGFACHQGRWHQVPQFGRVILHDDVNVGANTTIDCGALNDTIIEAGVKLDNQIQIGHNVRIGAHTIMAGCTGIAGSTKIGKHCMIGGGALINGHIEIVDGTVIMAGTGVTSSIQARGIFASGFGNCLEANLWRKIVVRIRHLNEMAKKVKELELLHKGEDDHE